MGAFLRFTLSGTCVSWHDSDPTRDRNSGVPVTAAETWEKPPRILMVQRHNLSLFSLSLVRQTATHELSLRKRLVQMQPAGSFRQRKYPKRALSMRFNHYLGSLRSRK